MGDLYYIVSYSALMDVIKNPYNLVPQLALLLD